MSTPKYASLATEDLKEAGSLWDNTDAKITGAKYTLEAPENYNAEGKPVFALLNFELPGDTPIEERQVSQSYSLGATAGDNFTISEDGFGLIPVNDDVQISKDSKWGTFVSVIQTAGLPKPILQAGDISKFVGLVGHFKRVADKERNFSEDTRTRPGQNANQKKRPPSTLVCTKIISLPGEVAKATPTATKTTAVAAPAAAAPAATTEDLDGQTAQILMDVLGAQKAAGKTTQRSQLTLLVSKAAMALPNRQDIAKRAVDEAFLATLVEAGVVVYNPAAKPQVVALAA